MALKDELRAQGNFLFRYRSYLPVIIIVAGLAVFVQTQMTTEAPSWIHLFNIGCFAVSALGLIIRMIFAKMIYNIFGGSDFPQAFAE